MNDRPAIPRPSPDEKAISSRDLADLALAGFVWIRQPVMQVSYEVHHVADRPHYLADRVANDDSGLGSNTRDVFAETLTSSANGIGFVVVTRTSVGMGNRPGKDDGDVGAVPRDTPESRIFHGTAQPNPGFNYESAWVFEGLVSIDPEVRRVSPRHCGQIRDIIREIAKMAKETGVPILSLQSPVQLPSEGLVPPVMQGVRDRLYLTPASSLAVRFALALEKPASSKKLDVSERLKRYCLQQGFGLWIADRRHGCRAGNWFPVVRPPHPATLSAAVPRCLPITFVGPARIGVTDAIVTFLSQYPNIGIAACSITSLDDLAFIHLQLAPDHMHERDWVNLDSEISSWRRRAKPRFDLQLRAVLQGLGCDMNVVPDPACRQLVKYAGDFQCLVGPSREVSVPDERKRMALWFSWSTRGAELDLAIPLNGLLDALEEVGFPMSAAGRTKPADVPNIEYLICRNKGNSVLRGKGKLSVPESTAFRLSMGATPERLGNLCVTIEQAWRANVARSAHGGVRELTLAWRESWLGHWSSPT